MKIKIIGINNSNKDLFSEMDPFFILERLNFPGYFALAAYTENVDNELDKPVGLMIYSRGDNDLTIEWLFVSIEYRLQGIGGEFISHIFELAIKENIALISARLCKEYGSEVICKGAETYFKEHLFNKEQALYGEWITNIMSLSDSPLFKLTAKTSPKTIALRNINDIQKKAGIESLLKTRGDKSLYPLKEEINRLDEDISFLIKDMNGFTSGILIQSTGTTLYPVFLLVRSKDEVLALLTASINAAKKKYKLSTNVRIILKSSEYVPLIEKFISSEKMENKLLFADTKVYLDEKIKLNDMPYYKYRQILLEDILLEDIKEVIEHEDSCVITSSDLIVTVKDIMQSPLSELKEPEDVVSIEDINLQQFRAGLLWCLSKRSRNWTDEDLSKKSIAWFETKLSCCAMVDNQIVGMFLIHREDSVNRLWIEYLVVAKGDAKKNISNLLKYAASRISELYTPETEIVIPCHNKEVVSLVSKLFPDKMISGDNY